MTVIITAEAQEAVAQAAQLIMIAIVLQAEVGHRGGPAKWMTADA